MESNYVAVSQNMDFNFNSGFEVEQNTLKGDFGGEASDSDDSSYKAYKSGTSYPDSFEFDGDRVDEPEVELVVKQYGRINRVVTKLTRNDKLRLKVVCVPSCPWTLWASKLNPKDPIDGSWQIKTLVNHHKCGKGLIEAISLLFPNAEARNCARHLYNNFKNMEGFKGQVIRKVMTRLVSMRKAAEKYPGLLCPRIQKKMSEIVSLSNNIWLVYAGNDKYEVDCGLGNKHVVDLLNSSCSYKKWDLSRIPCKHVVSCMQLLVVSPETYEHVRDMEPILPPIIRRPPGRPKQIRRKEVDEVRKSEPNLSKTGQQANCTKCGKPSHNTRTCKGIVGGNQMASQSSSLQILNQAISMDNRSSQPPLTQQSSNLKANFRAKLPFKRIYPFVAVYRFGSIGVAHNGNLVNYRALRAMLEDNGSIFNTSSDTDVVLYLIAISKARPFFLRIVKACEKLEGAYSMVFVTKDKLVVVCDPHGFRPLVMGRKSNGAVVFSSEACALDLIEATYEREAFGEILTTEAPVDYDVVIAVSDSGVEAE
ncbi:hypothetical protein GOBAR_DD18330 [Gossypium barbadense]|nr:hypothetical protein GOBAR_DD18330 [Gossypium barbadense]